MNWYKTVKIAGAKEKILKLNISNSFDQAYIYKYEKAMPWDTVLTDSDFRSYMAEAMLFLNKRKNSLENKKSIEIIENWKDTTIIWSEGGSRDSRSYLILEPLISWAETHKAEPPIGMPDAVESVLRRIEENPKDSINFLREYKKVATTIPRDDGWQYFQKGSDPKDLYFFTQGGGWCLSTTQYSEDYLSHSDIYIYSKGEKPVVAVSVNPEENRVVEVRGVANSTPNQYGLIIKAKTEEERWNTVGSSYYQLAVRPAVVNKKLEKNPSDQNALDEYKELLDMDCAMTAWGALSKKVKNNPAVRDVTENVLRSKLSGGVVSNCKYLIPLIFIDFEDVLADIFNKTMSSGKLLVIEMGSLPGGLKEKINWELYKSSWLTVLKRSYAISIRAVPAMFWNLVSDEEIAELLIKRFQGKAVQPEALTPILKAIGEQRIQHIQELLDEDMYKSCIQSIQDNDSMYHVFVGKLRGQKNEVRANLIKNEKETIIKRLVIEFTMFAASDDFSPTLYVPIELTEETQQAIRDYIAVLEPEKAQQETLKADQMRVANI